MKKSHKQYCGVALLCHVLMDLLIEEQIALEKSWLVLFESESTKRYSQINLVTLPHLVMNCILTKLDPKSLAIVSMTCSSMRTAVDTFLITNTVVDMTNKDCLSMAWDKRREAFIFLTRSGSISNLRELVLNDDLSSLQLIRKIISKNKKLEKLVLLNTKLSSSSISLIRKLTNLKQFILSYEMCEDESDEMFIEVKMSDQGCHCYRVMSMYHNYELADGDRVIGRPRLCSLCFTKFLSFSRFITHFRNIHSSPVKCQGCEEMYPIGRILQHKRLCQKKEMLGE